MASSKPAAHRGGPCEKGDEEMGYIDDAQSVDCDCGEPQTMYVCMYVCMYIFIHQTWIYRNYTVKMKIIIYSVKISSPIGTISNSEVVDSAIIVKLGKYKIICRHDSRL